MRSVISSYATRSLVSKRSLSLPAYRPGLTEVITRLQPLPTAGKPSKPRGNQAQLSVAIILIAFLGLLFTTSASAATAAPGWQIDSVAAPTNFSASQTAKCLEIRSLGSESPSCDAYEVSAMNAGSVPTDGGPVTLTDTLPQGVTVRAVHFYLTTNPNTIGSGNTGEREAGEIGGETVQLGQHPGGVSSLLCSVVPVQCTYSQALPPNAWLTMIVYVTVDEPEIAGPVTNAATVSGGGAAPVSTGEAGQIPSRTNAIDPAPAPFGPANFDFFKDGLNGAQETQAGGHPYELTTTIDLNSELSHAPTEPVNDRNATTSVEDVKDIVVDLPLGFAGSTLAAPQCTEAQLDSEAHCPPDTVVGHLTTEPLTDAAGTNVNGPIWNIAPERGHPAEFGYVNFLKGTHIAGYVSVVPTPKGYVLQFVAPEIPEVVLDPKGTNGDVNGIPIKLRRVDVEINRPNFTFNPTDCSKETFKVGGQITSVSGASKTLSTPFQVTNCGHLKFEPKVAISTSGKTSKTDGASLTYRVTYPNVGQGTDADIKYVKVELPKALPSRLTTLQKACTQKQFQSNPAGCPSASVIGHVKAIVPNIPVPLEGPVYFVSNGGEAFPNLVQVLQGDGVTVDLVGDTCISPQGVTSTTFHTIPDNPLTSVEITLPEGKYSALTANVNLCAPTTTKLVKKVTIRVKGRKRTVTRTSKKQVAEPLTMPTEFIAQNGAAIHEDTTIGVTGCGESAHPKKGKVKRRGKKGGKK